MRLVIADDSALIREGLTHLLPRHGFEVAVACSDRPTLTSAVQTTDPDVVLIDIRMPPTFRVEGIEAAKEIRRLYPKTAVLVLSQFVDADFAFELLNSSPSHCGYLLKDRITEVDRLVDSIRRVGRGECCIDPALVELLLHRPSAKTRLEQLTPRELEVLALIAEGLTDRGISDRLWLNAKTVETHVRHILAKLDLPAGHNRRVLAVLAYLRETGTPEVGH